MKKELYVLIALIIIGIVFFNFAKTEEVVIEEQIKEQARPSAMEGYIVMAHEVRTFRPCGEGAPEYWVLGDSNAYDDLKNSYTKEMESREASPYTPLYVEIEAKITEAPTDGFGADYDEGIRVESLIKYEKGGSCKNDLIKLNSPLPGETLTSPIKISGEARGYWFFEASFPIVLVDWDGRIIAEHYIMTADEWMTEDFVSFQGEVLFESPYKEGDPDFMRRGTLILQKDNPSDLPELDDALEVPITF